MNFAAAISTQTDPSKAAAELGERVRAQLGGERPDLTLMFVAPRYVDALEDLVEDVHVKLGSHHVIGCTGRGIIGVDHEVEDSPAISLWAARMPGVNVRPFRITQNQLDEASNPAYWHAELEVEPADEPSFIILPDPFGINASRLIQQLTEAFPGRPMVGGLASAADQSEENRIWINEQIFETGAVGAAITGPMTLQTIVSQGCKPIGEPYIVTKAQKNIILELGGRPPVIVLQHVLSELTERERRLAREALFIGRVVNEYLPEFQRGDFLIRNLIGLDPNSGAIAIGDPDIRVGQTVQFQIRDRMTAEEDLSELLEKNRGLLLRHPPQGVLLFSCLGRGENLFGKPDHDIKMIREKVGPLPIAGFFCNGEVGPIGDKVFVHGYTSVLGLFGPEN